MKEFLPTRGEVDFKLQIYYRPQRSCGQSSIFAPVFHSVHGGGGRGGIPEGTEADPPRTDPPPSRQPPPREQTPLEQTPPPEADSGIQSTSGRYASYWNAFLF